MAAAAGAGAGAKPAAALMAPADLKALSAFECVVTTIAGVTGKPGSSNSPDGSKATFTSPHGLALCVSADGKSSRLFVVDREAGVRGVDAAPPHGVWTAAIHSGEAYGITNVGSTGSIVVGSGRGIAFGQASVSAAAPAAELQALAGDSKTEGFADGDALTAARFSNVMGVCVTADGQRVYAADYWNHRVRLLDRQKGTVTTVAGTGARENGPDGPALSAALRSPYAVVFDPLTPEPESALFVGCFKAIHRVDLTTGQLTTVCSGFGGYALSLAAAPCGLLLAGTHGAIYAVEPRAGRNTQPARLAGDGKLGGSADGAARKGARTGEVYGLALDAARCCVWFTDFNGKTVRKLTLSPGVFVAPPKPGAIAAAAASDAKQPPPQPQPQPRAPVVPPKPAPAPLSPEVEDLKKQLAAAAAHQKAERAAAEARLVALSNELKGLKEKESDAQKLQRVIAELKADNNKLTAALNAAHLAPVTAELKEKAPSLWSARAVAHWLHTTPPLDTNDKLSPLRAECLRRCDANAADAVTGAALLALDLNALTEQFGAHLTDLQAATLLLNAIKPLKERDAKAKQPHGPAVADAALVARLEQRLAFADAAAAHNKAVAKMAAEYISLLERQAAATSTNPKLMGLLNGIYSETQNVSAKLDVTADHAAAAAAAAGAATAASS